MDCWQMERVLLVPSTWVASKASGKKDSQTWTPSKNRRCNVKRGLSKNHSNKISSIHWKNVRIRKMIIWRSETYVRNCSKLTVYLRISFDIWPPQNPDLIPIEILWEIVKGRLAGYERAPTNLYELWTRIQDEWTKIPQQTMPNSIQNEKNRRFMNKMLNYKK